MKHWRLKMECKKSWVDIKVNDIAELFRGITYKKIQASNIQETGYKPILRANNIYGGSLNFDELVYVPSYLIKDEQYIKKGDIVFAMSSGSKHLVGKSAQAKIDIDGSYGAFCSLLRINSNIPAEYISLFFQGNDFRILISKIAKGTNINNLKKEHILDFEIPLPPLPEQRAIVSKLEQLFSDLDNSIESFKKAQAQLKLYRQSVLKSACEGKLVPTEAELARREGRDYEATDVLLARILKERREKWNGKGKYKEPVAPDTSGLSELPEGWGWANVGQIAIVGTGTTPLKSKKEYYENGAIPWITSSALNELYIKEPNNYVTEKALQETNISLYPKHTILVAMYGEGKTRGKCSELLIEATTNQAIAALVLGDTSGTCRYFLKIFLVKNYDHTRLQSSGGVQPNLNLGLIRKITLPLPPLPEQRRIVIEVERRLSVCDKMEETITESLKKAESLRQSILKKAFEGKLLNEKELEEARAAPDWEPAGKLLESIKAEKINTQTKKKGKK